MRATFLHFAPPLIEDDEINEVVDTLRSGWVTTGPKTRQFETEFAHAVQAPAALALNSCTAGLHLALKTLGIGPGDEVVTTAWTFAASVNVIEHVGARPVIVDVEPETLNIHVDQVARAITPRTKAIIPVHFAGHPVDIDAINDLARRHNLAVVEDAAHGIGASYRGTPIGAGTNPTAFSFYATKNLCTGEGGMLTGSQEFLERARVTALHGMSREAWGRYQQGGAWAYDIIEPGFKYNMSDIQASLGLAQLRKFERLQARRREIVRQYHEAFSLLEAFELPATRPGIEHAWHLYVVRLLPKTLSIGRDEFLQALHARNIGCSVHFIPIPHHSYYREKYGLRLADFPVAADSFARACSLPLSPKLTDADVADVIEAVSDIAAEHRIARKVAA